MPAPQANKLIDALSPSLRAHVLSLCKPVTLPIKTTLAEADAPMQHAYFITSGIASIVIQLAEGGCAEVALVGSEGVVGGLQLLGPALAPSRCFIQIAATALRIPFADLKTLFRENEELRTLVLQHVQQQSLTMSQLSACNKLHEAEPRLARWLLMTQDRVGDSTLALTQEFLAEMLGTQRTTVVTVAGALQRSGLITLSRGKVTIDNRKALENTACHCYPIVRALAAELYQ